MPRPKLSRISKKKVRAPYTREAVEVEQEAPQKSPTEIIADEMVEMRKALVAGTANPTHLESIAQAMAVVAEHVANIGDIRPPGPIDVEALAKQVSEIDARLKNAEHVLPALTAPTAANVQAQLTKLAARVEALEQEYGKLRVMSADLKEGLNEVAEVAGAAPVQPAPANGVEAPKKKRGRPSNAELAARKLAEATDAAVKAEVQKVESQLEAAVDAGVEPEIVVPPMSAPVVQPKAATTSLEDEERAIQAFIESKPGVKVSEVMKQFKVSFNRATAYVETWGKAAVEEKPQQTVPPPLDGSAEVASPSPKQTPPAAQATVEATKTPTLDEVRATAITYAGKHTKEGLGKVLAKYGSDRLSGVPEEQRAALHAELLTGV